MGLTRYETTVVVSRVPQGTRVAKQLKYHWRPEDYDESDPYISGSDPPRWQAKHIVVATWDYDRTPWYVHAESFAQRSAAVGRAIGPAQLKVGFAAGYQVPLEFAVDVDCVRADGGIETNRAVVVAGRKGPGAGDPFGDVSPLVAVDPLWAEGKASPYTGVGMYVDVSDIRLVSPAEAPGCRLEIWNDNPSLRSQTLTVKSRAFTVFACAVGGAWGNPHMFDDSPGQVWLFYTDEGDIVFRRRHRVEDGWSAPLRVTDSGDCDYPVTGKLASGRIWLVYERDGDLMLRSSEDDGTAWSDEMALADDLSYPFVVEFSGVLYVIGYRNGDQYVRRTADLGRSFLGYANGQTESRIASSDAQRVGFAKMESQGRQLVVGVPRAPEIVTYVSTDDGWTWQQR